MLRWLPIPAALIVTAGFYWFGSQFNTPLKSETPTAIVSTIDTKIKWLNWSDAVFEKAKKNDKLVFLYLAPDWCRQCAVMETESFENETIAAQINEKFIPVRVDPEQRPDINDRYQLGGYPVCAILTPEAKILGGCSFVPTDSLSIFVSRISRGWLDHRNAALSQVDKMHNGYVEASKPGRVGVPSDLIVMQADETVRKMFDSTYGGFGGQPKFAYTDVNEFMFAAISPQGGPLFREQILATMDAQLALLDTVWGGFYRYSSFTDWSGQNREKLLDHNAAVLNNYLDAFQIIGDDKYKRAAEMTIRYLDLFLKSESGWGFYNSQSGFLEGNGDQSDPQSYFSLGDAARISAGVPHINKALYTESNCRMISAYLKAYRILGRDDCRDYAILTLDKIRTEAEGSEGGLYHDPLPKTDAPFGLLGDQIAAIQAFLDAYQTVGKRTYLSQAQRIAHFVSSRLQDQNSGGLFFGPNPGKRIGRMGVNFYPYIANCDAVSAFMRLSYLTADKKYKDHAERVLKYLTGIKIRDTDLRLAKLATSFLWRDHYPAKFVVVGKHGPDYQKLLEAAWKKYYPRMVLIQFETGKDKLQLGELTFPPSEKPMMFLCSEKLCSPPIENPDEADSQIKAFIQMISVPDTAAAEGTTH